MIYSRKKFYQLIRSDKFYSMNSRFKHWNSWIVRINRGYLTSSFFWPFFHWKTLLGSYTIYNCLQMNFWKFFSIHLISWCQNRIWGIKMEDLFSFFFFEKSSWRLCNAYSQTFRLHSSDIFCFSLHLWILI